MTEANKQLAMQVILEIVRQSTGDEIQGKTKLFKAFYFAHLYYAKDVGGCLTDWPIVRMPHGPGIDDFDVLATGLVECDLLIIKQGLMGPYVGTTYQATDARPPWPSLPPEMTNAIRKAVEFTAKKGASQLSNITHEFSKAWQNVTNNGRELSIYLDLLSDEDFDRMQQTSAELDESLAAVFGQSDGNQ